MSVDLLIHVLDSEFGTFHKLFDSVSDLKEVQTKTSTVFSKGHIDGKTVIIFVTGRYDVDGDIVISNALKLWNPTTFISLSHESGKSGPKCTVYDKNKPFTEEIFQKRFAQIAIQFQHDNWVIIVINKNPESLTDAIFMIRYGLYDHERCESIV